MYKRQNALVTTENINVKDKKRRARLIDAQRKKVAKHLKNNFFVWEPQTMDSVRSFRFCNLEECSLSSGMNEWVGKIEIKWRVTGYILSREHNGKNKLSPLEMLIDTPCKHSEIASFVADQLWAFIEEFQSGPQADNFITAAWVATKINAEHDESIMYKIFDKIGSWKLPTDGEEEKALSEDEG